MKKRSIILLSTILGFTATLGLVWCWWWLAFPHLPSTYTADPLYGTIVDAETGAPIEGAIVIGLWEMQMQYGFDSTAMTGHAQVTEVLTDQDGKYFIAGWGPKKRYGKSYLSDSSPLIVVFKEGYEYLLRGNTMYPSDQKYNPIRQFDWAGETLKLKKFNGNVKAYYNMLKRVNSALGTVTERTLGAGDCDWKKIPHMMLEFDKYYQILKIELPRAFYIIPSLDEVTRHRPCGSKEEFLKEFRQ